MTKKRDGKRDESYFAAERRKKKNTRILLTAAGIGAVLAMIAAAFAYQAINPPSPFVFGTAHEHAVFAVILGEEKIDFSQPRYQLQDQFIHVEGGDGTTLHRHATGVTFGYFLETIRMSIQDGCFVRDDGMQFCDDGVNQLRFFINGQEVDTVIDYIIEEGDRLLVIYGNQTDAVIQQELELLRNQPVIA